MQRFWIKCSNGFNYKIKVKQAYNKLYIFDESKYTDDITFEKAIAILTKIEDKYYIKSELIKVQNKILKITKHGYPINCNWAKSVEDVPDNPWLYQIIRSFGYNGKMMNNWKYI